MPAGASAMPVTCVLTGMAPAPDNSAMDFAHSPRAQDLRQRLEAFMQRYVLPYNAAWHQSVQYGIYPPPFLEDLKALAREEGL